MGGPLTRFPSSSEGRGNLNFFDERGRAGGHGETLKPNRASLRMTKSAEWNTMGDFGAAAVDSNSNHQV